MARHARDYLEDDGEDPDATLARVLGADGGGEDDDPYKELARVDQVLQFFEYEAESLEGYINEDFVFAEELERKRIAYYNMVNSVSLQNERIAFLVEDLLRLRKDVKGLRRDSVGIREKLSALASVKMDLGDVKSKRISKDRARKETMGDIIPMIVKVKTARLLAQAAFEQAQATRASAVEVTPEAPQDAQRKAPKGAAHSEASESSTVHASSVAHASLGARRRRARYSDEELSRLLRED